MPISIYKIKKWVKMLSGNSVYHVNQDEGKVYSKNEVKGYYNNLTEKITRFGRKDDSVPTCFVDTGEEVYFPIAIFQYGLAAYDLYLLNKDESMLDRVKNCANWAIENQQENGSWITFPFENKDFPYSSMAQGEGISLLIRAFLVFGDEKYKDASIKSRQFMLLPIAQGGTAEYINQDLLLYEYTYTPVILNGWIFSAWGLFDYAKAYNDKKALEEWDLCVKTIAKSLPKFDIGFWSKYDMGTTITSPFYHRLHIAQLNVLYELTGIDEFKYYAARWQKNLDNRFCRSLAFVCKSLQKIVK